MKLTDTWVLKNGKYKDAWYLAYDATPSNGTWITVHSHGKTTTSGEKAKGSHVLIDKTTGQILGGMGDKHKGMTISEVVSTNKKLKSLKKQFNLGSSSAKHSKPSPSVQPSAVPSTPSPKVQPSAVPSTPSPSVQPNAVPTIYKPSKSGQNAAINKYFGGVKPTANKVLAKLGLINSPGGLSNYFNFLGVPSSQLEDAISNGCKSWKKDFCDLFALAKSTLGKSHSSEANQTFFYDLVIEAGHKIRDKVTSSAIKHAEVQKLIKKHFSSSQYYKSKAYGSISAYNKIAESNYKVFSDSEKSKYKASADCSFNQQIKKQKPITGVEAHLATSGWADGHLSIDEMYALNLYTGSDYSSLNAALRAKAEGKLTSWGAYTLKYIDQAMEKSRSTQPMILHRGVYSLPDGFGVGEICEDLGYMSMASNKSASFGGTHITFKVPAGAKCVDVVGISKISSEHEILFARGTRYRVLKYDKAKHTAEVEILLPEDEK